MNQKIGLIAVIITGIIAVLISISLAVLAFIPWQMTGAIATGTGVILTAIIAISNIHTKQKTVNENLSATSLNKSGSWNPPPKINFNVSQQLLRILHFPTVGWEAYNDSPYQLRVRIEVHPILGGKDLHPLPDKHINGNSVYPVEPNSYLFANGCFTLPKICATSNDELVLEIRATVEDTNDLKKGKYRLIPRRWKYNRRSNSWSYHPQMLMPE